MKPYNDFTLVFQGPLHKNCIYGILNNYKDYTDNIIISHWNTDDLELLEYLSQENINCEVITNKSHKDYNIFNGQNVYYQIYTTLSGLKKVKTKYAIKLRTDQWFGNLVPFFEKIRSDSNKYICSNLHFRPDKFIKYHASDKLIGTNAEDLLKTFEIAMYRVKNNIQPLLAGAYMFTDDRDIISEKDLNKYMGVYSYADVNRKLITNYPEKPLVGTIQMLPYGYVGIVSEILFGTSYLFAKNIFPEPDNSIEIVFKNFDIVKVEDMVPYVNKDGTSAIEHNSPEINNISEYML